MCFQVGALGVDFVATLKVALMDPPLPEVGRLCPWHPSSRGPGRGRGGEGSSRGKQGLQCTHTLQPHHTGALALSPWHACLPRALPPARKPSQPGVVVRNGDIHGCCLSHGPDTLKRSSGQAGERGPAGGEQCVIDLICLSYNKSTVLVTRA